MTPEQTVEEIQRRRPSTRDGAALSVYWMTLSGSRDDFKQGLQHAGEEAAIVPWILRERGLFRDSNSVMNDVARILSDVRCEIEDIAEHARKQGGVILVILARDELRLAVTSSPILLPDWFPFMPGQTVTARIDDLTWSVNVALSSDIVATGELQRLLYELDERIVVRVLDARETDHRSVGALWEGIRRDKERDFVEVLNNIRTALSRVTNPTGFRPSRSRRPTMVGRLWFAVDRITPDKLPQLSKALASALGVHDPEVSHSRATLVGVLNRPTNPFPDDSTKWCFHLLVTSRYACQLVTSAAHADDYPLFPDTLLRSVSRDLREFLDEAIQILKTPTRLPGR